MSARAQTYRVIYSGGYGNPHGEATVTAHYVWSESNHSVTFSDHSARGVAVVAHFNNVISVEKQESK